MKYHLTTATFCVKREPPPWHVWHLMRPRDSQVTQGSFPLPLQFRHLQKRGENSFSKSLTSVGHHKNWHLLPEIPPTETMKEKEI